MNAKTISVRLDPTDVGRLQAQADRVGVSAGTYARVLIRAGLDEAHGPISRSRATKLRGLDKRLRAGWPEGAPAVDSIALVREGREERDRRLDEFGPPPTSS